MSFNKKLLWGGLGWVVAGPIGAILGYAYGSMNTEPKVLVQVQEEGMRLKPVTVIS